jgi:tetratricopeptide (TPR) repeat protein
VPDLGERCPDAPEALVDLVCRMLEKDCEQRIPSVRLVGAELEAIQKGRERLDPIMVKSPPTSGLPAFLERGVDIEQPVFVTRESELAQLDRLLSQALAGRGQVAFITGDPGQGKTALAREFARQAREKHPELVTASGNCNAYTGIGDPYLPFREILELLCGDIESPWETRAISRENAIRLWHCLPLAVQALVESGRNLVDVFIIGDTLTRRLADLPAWQERGNWLPKLERLVQHKATMPADPNFQQAALFEQYSRVLQAIARQRPLLLILDDLQWADNGSINLLFHLGKRIEGSRILILGAYRPSELALGRGGERHPLAPIVNELKRQYGEVQIELGKGSGRRFVDAFVDSEPNRLGEEFRATLARVTGGHPLGTVELLRDMQERGGLERDREGRWVEGRELDWDALPARVEAVIAERIERLDPTQRQVLKVASVEGETFTAEVVAHLLGADEREVVRQLGRLEREYRLVGAQGIRRLDTGLKSAKGTQRLSLYRFRHILFQRYLYNGLADAERAYLHEDVGTALEVLYGERAGEIAAQLAWHFQEAAITKKTVDYLGQAGEQAHQRYASEEAMDYFRRALALLEDGPPDASLQQAAIELYESLGDVLEFTDQSDEARTAYQNALASLPAQDRIREGRLHRKTGNTWLVPRRFENAMQAYDKAETALGQEPAEAASEWWQVWVDIQMARTNVHYFQGETRELTRLVETIRPVVEQHGTPLQRADFFLRLILMNNLRDRFIVSEQTLTLSRAYLEAAQELGSLSRIAHARFVLGFNLLWRGVFDEAEEQMKAALELSVRIGNRYLPTQCMTYLTIVYRKLGQVEMATDYALRSLEAATSVQNPAYIGAAQANLAWVACRKADMAEVLETGKAALESWQQSEDDFMFQWLALCPLISVALAEDSITEAVEYARGLLEPAQQALPDTLETSLKDAIEAWERGEPEAACAYFDRAIELSQEMGYL